MYKAIARNKRNTVILIGCFILILFLISAPLYYLAFTTPKTEKICTVTYSAHSASRCSFVDNNDPYYFLVIAIMISLFSIFYPIIRYKGAMKSIMKVTNAQKVELDDSHNLYRIIRSLSIGEGFNKVPDIYIIEDSAPNAFATGQDPERASIAVTTGLLEIMDERELRAVLAHEMSHIKNYDIRVSLTIFALIGTVVLLCDAIYMMSWSMVNGRRNRDRNNYGVLLGLIGLLISVFLPFLAGLLQLAVSRQREYLADESGAHLVNDPDSLISALNKLRKIGECPMKKQSNATANLFFNEPLKLNSFTSRLFSSHPPLEKRIERLMATKNKMYDIDKVSKNKLNKVLNS